MADKLLFVEKNIQVLRQIAAMTKDDFFGDFRNVDASIHRLQTTIDAMADISRHIAVRLRLGNPGKSVDGFILLIQAGILQKNDEQTYRQMVKFRNRIVHLYDEVNEEEVFRILSQHLEDLNRFVQQIKEYLVSNNES